MKNKNILIITFKFPPMGGIGSRRWAKFAKFLAKRNYHVHIITVNYPYVDKINWLADVQNNKNIIIHKIKSSYPLMFLKPQKNSLVKILFNIFKAIIVPFYFYLDYAQGWEKHLLPYAQKLIQEKNIKNVIVTGPPSSIYYTSSFLKIAYPFINLIHDYRDPWNTDRDYHYPNALKYFWQKEKSNYMEMFSVLHADKICLVTHDMKEQLANVYKLYKDKFFVIHNGYDEADFKNMKSKKNKDLSIGYFGHLPQGRLEAVELIARAIEKIKAEKKEFNIKIILYSNINQNYFKASPYLDVIKANFEFNPMVSVDEMKKTMSKFAYGLTINDKRDPHAFGTKIFEYMALKQTILCLSQKGELYQLLKKKGQYVADYRLDSIKKTLLAMEKDFKAGTVKKNDYQEFNLGHLTDKLEKLLID